MYKRSEKCLVYTTFFAPPPPPSVVQQKFSQLATSGMRRGLVGAGGGFGLGVAKVSEKEISHMDHELPTHDIHYFQFQDSPLINAAIICSHFHLLYAQ